MYGLVLEGGGAKGAYQIGACKALEEMGIEIGGVSGTSIGAINAAMIVQGDLEKAYEIWYNISPSKVFNVNEDYLEKIRNLKLDQENLQYFFKKAKDILNNRGLDTALMRKILQENIDEEKLRKSDLDFGFVTVSLSEMKPMEIYLEDVPPGKVIDYLMASARLPVFKLEKIDGKLYIDGGFYDNLPVGLLLKKGYKDIIVVRTHGLGIIRRIDEKGVNIKYIDPFDDLGNIFDFNRDSARKNLKLGYFDTYKAFEGLKGRKYYIEPKDDKEFYLQHLLGLDEESILTCGRNIGITDMSARRMLFEIIIPRLCELLNIKRESGYEDIVVLLYEILAGKYKVERFKMYSFEQLLNEIKKNYRPDPKKLARNIPQFIKHSEILSFAVKDKLLNEIITILFENNIKREIS